MPPGSRPRRRRRNVRLLALCGSRSSSRVAVPVGAEGFWTSATPRQASPGGGVSGLLEASGGARRLDAVGLALPFRPELPRLRLVGHGGGRRRLARDAWVLVERALCSGTATRRSKLAPLQALGGARRGASVGPACAFQGVALRRCWRPPFTSEERDAYKLVRTRRSTAGVLPLAFPSTPAARTAPRTPAE